MITFVRFMIEAIDLRGVDQDDVAAFNHPESRLPYVIHPACGSGTFLTPGDEYDYKHRKKIRKRFGVRSKTGAIL